MQASKQIILLRIAIVVKVIAKSIEHQRKKKGPCYCTQPTTPVTQAIVPGTLNFQEGATRRNFGKKQHRKALATHHLNPALHPHGNARMCRWFLQDAPRPQPNLPGPKSCEQEPALLDSKRAWDNRPSA